ncbi:MAG: hypothetical protein ABI408_07405 [Gemmatimonadaceae bacterium]
MRKNLPAGLTGPIGILTLILVGASACRTAAPSSSEPVVGVPNPLDELTLAGADSLVFAAVVSAQLAATNDDYPVHRAPLRIDPRPYGTPSGYPEMFAGVQGIDPTLTFARASQRQIDRLAENRRRVLDAKGATAGGPLVYAQCAGVRVPTPPPPKSRSRSRARPLDVHAGCPKTPVYYFTVGLPVRGQPTGLRNARDVRGHRLSLSGEVWTTLVDERSAGPAGWTWSQYAWVFNRNQSGQMELANAILVSVVE